MPLTTIDVHGPYEADVKHYPADATGREFSRVRLSTDYGTAVNLYFYAAADPLPLVNAFYAAIATLPPAPPPAGDLVAECTVCGGDVRPDADDAGVHHHTDPGGDADHPVELGWRPAGVAP